MGTATQYQLWEYHSAGTQNTLHSTSNGRTASAPASAPVAKINRLQVVSAAPHAYPPGDARVLLPLTLRGIRSGTVFLSPETLCSCIARNAGKPSPKSAPRSTRGEGRRQRCSTIDLSNTSSWRHPSCRGCVPVAKHNLRERGRAMARRRGQFAGPWVSGHTDACMHVGAGG